MRAVLYLALRSCSATSVVWPPGPEPVLARMSADASTGRRDSRFTLCSVEARMTDWIRVAPAADIKPGDYASVEVDGSFVAVYNVDGEFFAIDDVCTHDGGGLAGGEVQDHQVICPRHGARFCLRTGRALTPPAYEPVRSHPTRVVDGFIEVASE
jgi:3-phenylpropionate/trans-cinnamate dioxygenase ferredoxin component